MTNDVEVQVLIDALPDPDDNGFLRQIDAEVTEQTLQRMAGAASVVAEALLQLLRDPEEGGDEKVRYGLHALIIYAARTGNEPLREKLVEAISSGVLDQDQPIRVREFLLQQLQVCGRKEAISVLSQLLTDERLCEAATQALLALDQGADEPIRSALAVAPDGCRLTLVQAAGRLQDKRSAEKLRELLDDEDPEIRLTAGWGLAHMGDAGSVDLLIKAAEVPYSYERMKATDHLLALANNLRAEGRSDEARRIYNHLEQTRLDPQEKHVREVAAAQRTSLDEAGE